MLPHGNGRELLLEDQLLRRDPDGLCVDLVLKLVDVVGTALGLRHLAPQVVGR